MRIRRIALTGLALSCLLMAGCFDIEQTLMLERNMSGKAGFNMKVNMEPMVAFMAQMTRSMAGKEGPPTAEDLAAARKEVSSSKTGSSPGDFEKDKKELESKLPKGVTLLESSFKETGLKVAVGFLFGFDQLAKLSQINFPKSKEQSGAPGNPVDSPFGGLKVVDDGKTILVTSPVENPVAEQKDQIPPPTDPEALKQIEALFGGLRVAFKITAPFQIIEQNAHRKEGNTLVWEYTMESFTKLTPAQLKQGIKVRYQK